MGLKEILATQFNAQFPLRDGLYYMGEMFSPRMEKDEDITFNVAHIRQGDSRGFVRYTSTPPQATILYNFQSKDGTLEQIFISLLPTHMEATIRPAPESQQVGDDAFPQKDDWIPQASLFIRQRGDHKPHLGRIEDAFKSIKAGQTYPLLLPKLII